jgi:hypothetical protein
MALIISIEELEATINWIRRVAPPVNGVLSPDLRVLAEIYGNMIYAHARSVDLDKLAESIRPTAIRLLETSKTVKSPIDVINTVCPYGPDVESCDACQ